MLVGNITTMVTYQAALPTQGDLRVITITRLPVSLLGEAEVKFRFGCGWGENLSVALLQTVLQLSVTHHQDVLLVPRHQTHLGRRWQLTRRNIWIQISHLVRHASIKSIEAGDDVSHVKEWSPVLHHLVEHVVPEQLQHVPVAGLGPGRVKIKFRPVDDCPQLCQ